MNTIRGRSNISTRFPATSYGDHTSLDSCISINKHFKTLSRLLLCTLLSSNASLPCSHGVGPEMLQWEQALHETWERMVEGFFELLLLVMDEHGRRKLDQCTDMCTKYNGSAIVIAHLWPEMIRIIHVPKSQPHTHEHSFSWRASKPCHSWELLQNHSKAPIQYRSTEFGSTSYVNHTSWMVAYPSTNTSKLSADCCFAPCYPPTLRCPLGRA